jgi:glycosyltransferase involved in cell wall biosynthesis
MSQSVLFVSKPIAPPFHDGSKCLVRDVARNLTRIDPVVLSTPGAPPLSAAPGARRVRSVSAYGTPGAFTPALSANLRAASWLLLRSRASVWHFVFAPNPRTSSAGRFLSRLRGVPVVQTVASPPRSFERPERLFFGSVLVAQSAWTRRAIETSHEASGLPVPRLFVIPPPVPELSLPTAEAVATARASLELGPRAQFVIYPGDLETSSGAETTAELAERLALSVPDCVTVFAYRRKSAAAAEVAKRLSARLSASRTRFVENAPDILALLAGARAVVFPVDDLWGKVDLPIVLLEAMALGVPVIALDQGPLCDLAGAVKVASLEIESWLAAVTALLGDAERCAFVAARQREALDARHRASSVARAYEDLYLELAR